MSKYYCKNCGVEIKPTDTFCPNCWANLSQVGRRIEATFTETLGSSDNKGLATRITGDLTNATVDIVRTSSFINAIPKERQEEIGIGEEFLKTLKDVNQNLIRLAEVYKTPDITINANNIAGQIQISQRGNNIVVVNKTDIETLDKVSQEVEKTDVDPKIKAQAKSIVDELKEEIGKEKRDKSKILKMWDEFKTLLPLVAPLLEAIISKALLG